MLTCGFCQREFIPRYPTQTRFCKVKCRVRYFEVKDIEERRRMYLDLGYNEIWARRVAGEIRALETIQHHDWQFGLQAIQQSRAECEHVQVYEVHTPEHHPLTDPDYFYRDTCRMPEGLPLSAELLEGVGKHNWQVGGASGASIEGKVTDKAMGADE